MPRIPLRGYIKTTCLCPPHHYTSITQCTLTQRVRTLPTGQILRLYIELGLDVTKPVETEANVMTVFLIVAITIVYTCLLESRLFETELSSGK